MLLKLLSRTDRTRFAPVVLTLSDEGPLRERIRALGIPLYSLHMKPRRPSPAALGRLGRVLRRVRPDLIQGWLIQGNVFSVGAGWAQLGSSLGAGKRTPVVWNCRNALDSMPNASRSFVLAYQFSALLSRFPIAIINNARVSARQHEELGYPPEKTVLIPNGFDTQLFSPAPDARLAVRKELGLPDDSLLIGLFARYHPMKDHANFLHAAARLQTLLLQTPSPVHFVLAGRGVNGENETLSTLIDELKLAPHMHLLGERHDMAHLHAAMDIATCCSAYDEGFANVVGEAMSCGVPCAVTDVSDSAWIVGQTGRVVPPCDAHALAAAWRELIELGADGRARLGQAARARVLEVFSLDAVTTQYEALYEKLLAR